MKIVHKKKGVLLFLLVGLLANSTTSNAQFHQHISRANCINNESISYDVLLGAFRAKVDTAHVKSGINHAFSSSPTHVFNWRHAAIHWGEGTGGWYVLGRHCAYKPSAGRMGLWFSEATACIGSTENIY